jgi:hypothetical protein
VVKIGAGPAAPVTAAFATDGDVDVGDVDALARHRRDGGGDGRVGRAGGGGLEGCRLQVLRVLLDGGAGGGEAPGGEEESSGEGRGSVRIFFIVRVSFHGWQLDFKTALQRGRSGFPETTRTVSRTVTTEATIGVVGGHACGLHMDLLRWRGAGLRSKVMTAVPADISVA